MNKSEVSKLEKILTVIGFVVALFFITKGSKMDSNIKKK